MNSAFRNTKQRQAILDAIELAGRPLTPQEVLDHAQQNVPAMGIATVYRNLKRLVEQGQLSVVELPAEASRYELARCAVNHGHHHHFLCTKCDRAFEVHGCASNFETMLPSGFQMKSHEITLYGLCKECNP